MPDVRVGGLPPTIAFLAGFGVAPGLLLAAMSSAAAQGVSADAALLALPGFNADDFYQYLARHLGVRFETGPVRFDPSVQWPAAIHAGLAATIAEDGRLVWLLAPRADRVASLLEAHSRGELSTDRVVLTSPARFAAMLNAARPEAIRRQASLALPAALGEDLSARTGCSPCQRRIAAVAALMVALAVAFGGIYWAGLSALCGLILTGAILLRLFAMAASLEFVERRPAAALADHALPVYSVIVALYREAPVISHLVEALDALDYPALGSKLT